MTNILHFNPNDNATAVCGTRVFVVDAYTDNPHHVECERCKRTKAFLGYDPRRFNVDVWTWDGDVVRSAKGATGEEAEHIRGLYADNPSVQVVIEEIL